MIVVKSIHPLPCPYKHMIVKSGPLYLLAFNFDWIFLGLFLNHNFSHYKLSKCIQTKLVKAEREYRNCEGERVV